MAPSPRPRPSPRLRGGAVPSGPALDPDSVLDEANGLLTTLADHEREREELLGKMGKEGFWDTEAERTATVERFRTVDVAVGIEQRLARPILALRDALRDAPFSELPNGAGLLGQARAALRRWQERRRLEGPSAAWLVVSAVDAFHPPEKWLAELAGIELAYCRRAELHGQVEAFELRQEKLVRVVLEVEGPGASHFLSGEVGIHRRRRGGDHDVRAHVELVPQGGGGATTIAVRTHARRHGPLSMSATASARFKIPTRGQRVELLGREGPTLERLAQDLWTSWSRPAGDTPEECRVYGEPSGSVVDPRTGASVPWRVAGKGRLEPFFEAWRRSTTRDVEGSGARASTTGAGDPATS